MVERTHEIYNSGCSLTLCSDQFPIMIVFGKRHLRVNSYLQTHLMPSCKIPITRELGLVKRQAGRVDSIQQNGNPPTVVENHTEASPICVPTTKQRPCGLYLL